MRAEKKSFVLYHDIREPLEQLTMEQRGELFTAILNYSENGTIPDFRGELRMAFAFIRGALDRDAAAWEAKREKRVAAGRQGGLTKAANGRIAKQNYQTLTNQAVHVPVPVPAPVVKVSNVSNATSSPDVPDYGPSGKVDNDLAPWILEKMEGRQ